MARFSSARTGGIIVHGMQLLFMLFSMSTG
jgi:hypothetical protein